MLRGGEQKARWISDDVGAARRKTRRRIGSSTSLWRKRWAHAMSPPQPDGERDAASHVQVRHRQRVLLDEGAAWFDNVAHQAGEDLVGLAQVADFHLQQRARVLVE